MTASDIFIAFGGVGALIAAGAFIGKLILQKFSDAALKKFEHSLDVVSRDHQAKLARMADEHKTLVGFSAAIDTDLRMRRAEVYGELWKITSIIPKWPRNADLRYEHFETFSKSLRTWYFETGGMYLSKEARDAYGEVQEKNELMIKKKRLGRVNVDGEDYTLLMNACSELRTRLTDDIRSRGELPTYVPTAPTETTST